MQRTNDYSVPTRTPTGHIYNTTPTPTNQEYGAGWGGGQNDSKSPEDQKICCKILSSEKDRETSPRLPPQ